MLMNAYWMYAVGLNVCVKVCTPKNVCVLDCVFVCVLSMGTTWINDFGDMHGQQSLYS